MAVLSSFDARSQVEINVYYRELAKMIFPRIYPNEQETPETITAIAQEILAMQIAKQKEKVEKIKLAKGIKRNFQDKIEDNLRVAYKQQQDFPAKNFKLELGDIAQDIMDNLEANHEDLNGKLMSMASYQGQRPHMEDAYLAVMLEFRAGDQTYQAQLVGVFDGHGDTNDPTQFKEGLSPGAQAAYFVRDNLKESLIQALESHNSQNLTDEGIFKALTACLKKMDQDYTGKGGTTAIVAFILGKKIWIGNVGDSRAIFVDRTQVRQVSADADLLDKRYLNKIYQLGGLVFFARDALRINGYVAMARAIGDHEITGNTGLRCIPANPEITCIPFGETEEGEYLILMSDGLTVAASTDKIGTTMMELLTQGYSVGDVAKYLTYGAFANESTDNITVVIVKLS